MVPPLIALAVALAAPASAETRDSDALREALVDAINLEREKAGKKPLDLHRKLGAAAEDRLRDMFERRYFGHVAPDGTRPDAWVRRRGYDFVAVGENLASGQRTAPQAVARWMRSRGHRATLLGDFEDVGIAVAPGSPTRRRAQGYTFVALFARDR